MKIGIDISQVIYGTGVSRYTAELVKSLLQLKTSDQFYLWGGSLQRQNDLKLFISSLSPQPSGFKVSFISPQLADTVFNRLNFPILGDFDVFHASNWSLPKFGGALVTTIHDLTFIKYPKTHSSSSVATHTRHLKRAQKLATQIITDSKSSKQDLVEWGIDPQKIRVVYLAPSKIFRPTGKSTPTKPYLLSVATQEPRKNLPRLIEAFKLVRNHYPKLELWLVGKAGFDKTITTSPGVKYLGFVADKDLPKLYTNATAFMYPSIYEGFGFPILEAFACGCPVVTSNVSSMPELGGQAALYVDPFSVSSIAATIKKLLTVTNRKLLVDKGFKQQQSFSWANTAKQTLSVYKEAYEINRH